MSLAVDVLAHLRRQRDAMASYATRLVALESPSRDAAAQETVFRVFGAALEEQGFRLRRRPGAASAGVLLALPRARRRPGRYQVLLGHGDTVWPRGTLVDMPARRESGVLHGPGVYDLSLTVEDGETMVDLFLDLDREEDLGEASEKRPGKGPRRRR